MVHDQDTIACHDAAGTLAGNAPLPSHFYCLFRILGRCLIRTLSHDPLALDPDCIHIVNALVEAGSTYHVVCSDDNDFNALLPAWGIREAYVGPANTLASVRSHPLNNPFPAHPALCQILHASCCCMLVLTPPAERFATQRQLKCKHLGYQVLSWLVMWKRDHSLALARCLTVCTPRAGALVERVTGSDLHWGADGCLRVRCRARSSRPTPPSARAMPPPSWQCPTPPPQRPPPRRFAPLAAHFRVTRG